MLRTKIVASFGPACHDREILQRMYREGMRVVRLNTSFLTPQATSESLDFVRETLPDVAILVDLQGFKIRITGLDAAIPISAGAQVILTTDKHLAAQKQQQEKAGSSSEPIPVLGVDYPHLLDALQKGTIIHINEGKIILRAVDCSENACTCDVVVGGDIIPRKTVNLPGTALDFPSLSDKDKAIALVAKEKQAEFLALSFVRSAADVADARQLLGKTTTKLIAKIENKEGMKNFQEILDNVDGVMVARGDLGVELPLEKVPLLQKQFIKKARKLGKPCIVATHMLESMIHEVVPTRAEVSDIANAVFDGTDALMLSAETATGHYPVKAVAAMAKIAREMEHHYDEDQSFVRHSVANEITDAVTSAAIQIIEKLPITAILVGTSSGTTARSIACYHPKPPVYAFTETIQAARQLNLTFGVHARCMCAQSDKLISIDNMLSTALREKLVKPGSLVLIISGENLMASGATNVLTVRRVEESDA